MAKFKSDEQRKAVMAKLKPGKGTGRRGKVSGYDGYEGRKYLKAKPKNNMKDWKIDKQQSRENYFVWDNSHSNVTIKAWKPLHDEYWAVSILGRGRYQPEYLAGGNSRIHNASKTKALKLAKDWMKEHPNG